MSTRTALSRGLSSVRPVLRRTGVGPWLDTHPIRLLGLSALLRQTDNFAHTTWLGHPVWQNLADIWTIQELIVDRDVDLVVECGTNRGGSALFVATIFDLLGRGGVITIDIAELVDFTHPRIEFLHGSSTDRAMVDEVKRRVATISPREILVLLDSDHSAGHVLAELRAYSPLVPVDGYLIVQDGVLDELPGYRALTPGPLVAIRQFLAEDGGFVVDEARSTKFLFHSSPSGCLRRVR